jgi:hypothetical protein
MADRCFLTTYRPLIQSNKGRAAVQKHALSPFIDGSCRREPDFESAFPSITATCRAGNFAPRLQIGDRIAYLTVKGKYPGNREPGWRLDAVQRDIQRLSSHSEAASWYERQGQPLPSNCLVEGNPPKPFDLTNGNPPAEVKKRVATEPDFVRAIRLWDAVYRQRVAAWPVFLVTEAEFLELNNPLHVLASHMIEAFGRLPATLNPPEIACERLERLVQLATGCAV